MTINILHKLKKVFSVISLISFILIVLGILIVLIVGANTHEGLFTLITYLELAFLPQIFYFSLILAIVFQFIIFLLKKFSKHA